MIVGLEFALVIGVVLGLAVWELLRLRRDKSGDDKTSGSVRKNGQEQD